METKKVRTTMTKHMIDQLAGTSTITPVDAPTRKQLLLTVARMFRKRGQEVFSAIQDVEYKTDPVIEAIETAGTALEPVVTVLNAANVPTKPNALAVRHSLGLTNPELHDLVCACKGEFPTGDTLAKRFSDLAARC